MQGETNEDFALSEMLIEESDDILNLLIEAKHRTSKEQACIDLFRLGGKFDVQLRYLERLLIGDDTCPCFSCVPGTTRPKKLAGGCAIAAVLDIALGLNAAALDSFPKVKMFHRTVVSSAAFDTIRDWPNALASFAHEAHQKAAATISSEGKASTVVA